MATVLERVQRLETKLEDLERRMNQNGGWLRFLIAQAIQAVILGTAVVTAIAAIFRHGG